MKIEVTVKTSIEVTAPRASKKAMEQIIKGVSSALEEKAKEFVKDREEKRAEDEEEEKAGYY